MNNQNYTEVTEATPVLTSILKEVKSGDGLLKDYWVSTDTFLQVLFEQNLVQAYAGSHQILILDGEDHGQCKIHQYLLE